MSGAHGRANSWIYPHPLPNPSAKSLSIHGSVGAELALPNSKGAASGAPTVTGGRDDTPLEREWLGAFFTPPFLKRDSEGICPGLRVGPASPDRCPGQACRS